MAWMQERDARRQRPDRRGRKEPSTLLCRNLGRSLEEANAVARSRPPRPTAPAPTPVRREPAVELSCCAPTTSPRTDPADSTRRVSGGSTPGLKSPRFSCLIPSMRSVSPLAGFCCALLCASLATSCRPSEQRYKVLESGSEIMRPECVSCEGLGYAPPKLICGRCSGTGLDQRHTAAWPEPPHPMWHTGRPYGEPEKPIEPARTQDR